MRFKLRHLVANLTAEDTWAGRRPQLSAKALATVAGLSTLLRAFAREGDVLHLPAAVDPARLPEIPGLPGPRLASGRLDRLAPAAAVLAWGETAEVARHRARGAAGAEAGSGDLSDCLWTLAPPTPEAAARANHRGFCLETAEALGVALPGARMVSSVGEIEVALGASGPWILKAPFSAAGRDRALLSGKADLRPGATRNRIEALLARHGELLLEPWMERTEDFGCSAILTESDLRIVAFHRQRVDRAGQPAGFVLPVTFREIARISAEERRELERVLEGVATALRRIGYRGPFGLDVWRHRAPSGEIRFHPLGEINARMTLGLVARALADRLRGPLGWDPDSEAELILAATAPGSGSAPLYSLLAPGPEGALGAWIRAPRIPAWTA